MRKFKRSAVTTLRDTYKSHKTAPFIHTTQRCLCAPSERNSSHSIQKVGAKLSLWIRMGHTCVLHFNRSMWLYEMQEIFFSKFLSRELWDACGKCAFCILNMSVQKHDFTIRQMNDGDDDDVSDLVLISIRIWPNSKIKCFCFVCCCFITFYVMYNCTLFVVVTIVFTTDSKTVILKNGCTHSKSMHSEK